ncbi:DUF7144 family membrane protein [Streptomyces sp. SR27]
MSRTEGSVARAVQHQEEPAMTSHVTGWGWIHLFMGVLCTLAGLAL